MKDLKKMTPAEVLENERYAVMAYFGLATRPTYVHSIHFDHYDAQRECDALNVIGGSSHYAVVEIDHGSDEDKPNLSACVEAAKHAPITASVDTSDGENALKVLRYVYTMLNDEELIASEVLDRMRGYCEASGLVEFA
jgi:hypothetical protein